MAWITNLDARRKVQALEVEVVIVWLRKVHGLADLCNAKNTNTYKFGVLMCDSARICGSRMPLAKPDKKECC